MTNSAVLLDTHTLIWFDTAPEKLPDVILNTIRNQNRQVYVSVITAWELSIKHHLGKLPEVEELLGEYHETLARYGFTELHFTSVHALLAGSLESEHKDPFDRALVSQAMSEQLPIVSKDPAIHSFKGIKPLW